MNYSRIFQYFQIMVEHGQLKLQKEKPRIKEDINMICIYTQVNYVLVETNGNAHVCVCMCPYAYIPLCLCIIVCGDYSTLSARDRVFLTTWA